MCDRKKIESAQHQQLPAPSSRSASIANGGPTSNSSSSSSTDGTTSTACQTPTQNKVIKAGMPSFCPNCFRVRSHGLTGGLEITNSSISSLESAFSPLLWAKEQILQHFSCQKMLCTLKLRNIPTPLSRLGYAVPTNIHQRGYGGGSVAFDACLRRKAKPCQPIPASLPSSVHRASLPSSVHRPGMFWSGFVRWAENTCAVSCCNRRIE